MNILYCVFREMYIKYWYKLSVISSNDESSLYLCKMFENLLTQKLPNVFYRYI